MAFTEYEGPQPSMKRVSSASDMKYSFFGCHGRNPSSRDSNRCTGAATCSANAVASPAMSNASVASTLAAWWAPMVLADHLHRQPGEHDLGPREPHEANRVGE